MIDTKSFFSHIHINHSQLKKFLFFPLHKPPLKQSLITRNNTIKKIIPAKYRKDTLIGKICRHLSRVKLGYKTCFLSS